MNWGYKIVLLYTVFVAGILYLVYRCTGEDIDLVEKDYYARELAFQQRIDGEMNAENSAFKMSISYDSTLQKVIVEYPDTLKKSKNEGYIIFYRPDNAKLDFKVPVDASGGKQEISTSQLLHGFWRVKADFKSGSTLLYQEQKIFI